MQRESVSAVRRCLRPLLRRLSACLALAAAFAFVLDGALAFNRHLGEGGAYHGTHVHFHLPVHGTTHAHHHHGPGEATHHHANGSHGDLIEHEHTGTAVPHTDASTCCYAACSIGAMLLCLGLQAEVRPLRADVAKPPRAASNGIEPEGPRKPPRPSALA